MIALLIYIANITGFNNNNPVNLGHLTPHTNHSKHADHAEYANHVDHANHVNLYILKEPTFNYVL